jgi:hypothetical protein
MAKMVRTKLKIHEVATSVCAYSSLTVDESQQQLVSHVAFHKILSDNLNMCHVTQHNVACVLALNTDMT